MMTRLLLLALLAAFLGIAAAAQPPSPSLPNIALYYGSAPPWDELAAFDVVVVEPGNVPDPRALAGTKTELFAYVSIGEVHPTRSYFPALPESWKAGPNTAWGSIVVDQSQREWPRWIVEHAIRPLWQAGYRGFFLDTLDSYHLYAKTDSARAAQEAGLSRVVAEIRRTIPEAKLIFNRGFEILPSVHKDVYAVAAESLFRGYDQAAKSYREVPEADRTWLLGQLHRVRDEYRLPVLAIDYVPAENRELARVTAKQITALGFVPWISTPELDLLGVGAIEVMPRKVLMLYDADREGMPFILEDIHRFATLPVHYLGYTAEYREASKPLPAHPLAGRYAGIIAWFSSEEAGPERDLSGFFRRAIDQGVKIAVLGSFGVRRSEVVDRTFGTRSALPVAPPTRVSIQTQDPLIGYEVQPLPRRQDFYPLHAPGDRPLLRLRSDRGESMDAAALTPWGGYVLFPYHLMPLPAEKGNRWIVNPIEFVRSALALPDMPVPDVTTENGRRLLIAHVDGDGFANRAELPGAPFAGEVMLKEFLERYRLPTTVSVIQGEIAPNGLNASSSPQLEDLAKRVFRLPSVEIASHSFSHPFRWRKLESHETSETYNLSLPGYQFDIRAEIDGSVNYINTRLAPPGKKTSVFLWTGDCNPGEDSLERTTEVGVLNMNGGDTWITRAEPSLTIVSPLGVPKGRNFQVYAPNQNENVYTNLWTGPFYGYERAIETFELTDAPYRLKPVNIYYHTYAATKRASIASLHKVYRWAIERPLFNIFASDYVRKVLDFNRVVVARTRDGWLVRGTNELRTLRIHSRAGIPDIGRSGNLVGYAKHNDQYYLHLGADEARIALQPVPAPVPYLAEANARVDRHERDSNPAAGMVMTLSSPMQIAFSLANAGGCEVRAGNSPLKPARVAGGLTSFELKNNGTATITVRCRP